jgi:hypothetical protein
MKKPRKSFAVIVLALGTAASAFAIDVIGHCEIEFFGTSTLKDFSGTVTSREFAAEFPENPTDLTPLRDRPVVVRVKDMDTGKRRMNQNMYKMFEADMFPFITGRLIETPAGKSAEKITAISAAPDEGEEKPPLATTYLKLRVRDQERIVEAKVTQLRRTAEKLSFDLEFNLLLTDFGITPPTFLKILKVGNHVRVETKVILEKKGSSESVVER